MCLFAWRMYSSPPPFPSTDDLIQSPLSTASSGRFSFPFWGCFKDRYWCFLSLYCLPVLASETSTSAGVARFHHVMGFWVASTLSLMMVDISAAILFWVLHGNWSVDVRSCYWLRPLLFAAVMVVHRQCLRRSLAPRALSGHSVAATSSRGGAAEARQVRAALAMPSGGERQGSLVAGMPVDLVVVDVPAEPGAASASLGLGVPRGGGPGHSAVWTAVVSGGAYVRCGLNSEGTARARRTRLMLLVLVSKIACWQFGNKEGQQGVVMPEAQAASPPRLLCSQMQWTRERSALSWESEAYAGLLWELWGVSSKVADEKVLFPH